MDDYATKKKKGKLHLLSIPIKELTGTQISNRVNENGNMHKCGEYNNQPEPGGPVSNTI